MPVYGYRLFVVQLFAGMARTPVDFSECGGKHYIDIATQLLKDMRGVTLVQPKRTDLAADEDVVEAEAQTTIDPLAGRKGLAVRVVHQEGALIYGEALVGTFGDHEAALAAPPELVEVPLPDVGEDAGEPEFLPPLASEDIDLKGRAPARRFRFVLNLPAEGTLGALFVEDISRSCPVDLIVGWLRRRAKDAADATLAEVSEDATSAERRKAAAWWRLMATAAIDDQHFNEMLEQGHLNKVELVRHSIASDGTRGAEDLRLTAPRPEALTPADDLVQLAKDWYQVYKERRNKVIDGQPAKRLSKDERKAVKAQELEVKNQTDQEAAQEMAALLGNPVVDLSFDDGWLVLQDGDRTKRISPSRISELFTYEIDRERRPSNLDFYKAGRFRAQRLANPLKLHLEWPATIAVKETEGS